MTFFAILNEWHCWESELGKFKNGKHKLPEFFFYEDKYESLVKKKWEG